MLFEHARRICQVLRHFRVAVGLLLVALASLLEELASGLPQLAEDWAERVQAFLNLLVRRREGPEILGCLFVVAGRFTQVGGHHVDSVCHPLSPLDVPAGAGFLLRSLGSLGR